VREKSLLACLVMKTRDDNDLREHVRTHKFVKRQISFSHEHCTTFTYEVEHADIGSLINEIILDSFVDGQKGPCFPPDDRPRFEDPNYRYQDLVDGEQWWADRELVRTIHGSKDVELLPLIFFCDGTAISNYGDTFVPMYVAAGIHGFRHRNKHKYLLGFFP
jgi:hypothetical protein